MIVYQADHKDDQKDGPHFPSRENNLTSSIFGKKGPPFSFKLCLETRAQETLSCLKNRSSPSLVSLFKKIPPSEMSEEKQKEGKDSESDVMLWIGGGALLLAAGAVTLYVIQKQREEELNVMREAPGRQPSSASEIIAAGRKKLASFWSSLSGAVSSLLVHEQPAFEVKRRGAYDGSPEEAFREETARDT